MFKRPGFWIATLMVVAAVMLVVTTVTPVKNLVFGRPQCAASAIKQLPEQVVAIVNKQQDLHRIFNSKDLAARDLNEGWQSVAHVSFVPKYCGFVGNVTQQPATEAARTGKAEEYTSEAVRSDKVNRVRNGKPFVRPGNDICISNTVPVVVETDTSLEMTFMCDRLYDEATWGDTSPQLVELQ